MTVQLFCGDCLEKMKDIADNSINLVVIDPPYNIKKAKWDKWKTVESYVDFMGLVFLECQRVLKDNGSFYFFHNDFLQIVELQNKINNETNFIFNSMIHWIKPNFRPLSWKNPSSESNLRSWFNCVEYCLFYTFQDSTGLTEIYADNCLFKPIRNYLNQERKMLNLSLSSINILLEYPSNGGGFASHYFTESGKQWGFIPRHHYEMLQIKTNGFAKEYEALRQEYEALRQEYEALRQEYEALRQEYEALRQEYEALRYTHNLDENHNNIWESKTKNNGKLHPTEKPLDIIDRIIKTSSNEGDTVLDCFLGSGTTGAASVNLNRNFIGIEKDPRYFEIAKERIAEAERRKNNEFFVKKPDSPTLFDFMLEDKQ